MNWDTPPPPQQDPDFNNLLAVLNRETPSRPTLFEFFMNRPLYGRLTGTTLCEEPTFIDQARLKIDAFKAAGYDYVTSIVPGFGFPAGPHGHKESRSLNEGFVITDRATYESYEWQDPRSASFGVLDAMAKIMPEGMKLVLHGPSGVLENTISLAGFENLCYMLIDDDELAKDIFDAVGSRLLTYYEYGLEHDIVGAIIGNDDWGFKSQTMLAPDQMRKYVFPWHERIVNTAHAAGRPAILHSCGYLLDVMDDITDGIGYDGKHSYEDAIQPVEEAYDAYHSRIAIMGGIDVDFVCRHSPEEIYERSKAMLLKSATDGAYALGTGNSVPTYVPDEGYFAMIRACHDMRG